MSAPAIEAVSATPALSFRARHRLGAFTLDLAFDAAPGVTALFGRSGAGKTTAAQALAGLLRPDHGRIALSGQVLFDSETGVFLPPHRRRIGYVFQEGRLFPHLSVRRNLLFSQRFSARRSGDAASFERIVALLGLAPLLERRPGALSGGEQQRVAIGRALLSRPALLVMDEPLASLDQARKAEILPYLEGLRDEIGLPILYVSHSLEEVSRLATTLIAMERGRAIRVGPAETLLADPSLFPLFGRREAGVMLEGRVAADPPDEALRDEGLTAIETGGGLLYLARTDLAPGATLRLRVRAQDVMIASAPVEGLSALNQLQATVAAIGEGGGAMVEVALLCGDQRLLARITKRSLRRLGLSPGAPCVAILKAAALGRRDVQATS
ncbi:MAG: molybdenum ABC transporter ATP-binding protein [Pseudomonadota bacterium]